MQRMAIHLLKSLEFSSSEFFEFFESCGTAEKKIELMLAMPEKVMEVSLHGTKSDDTKTLGLGHPGEQRVRCVLDEERAPF